MYGTCVDETLSQAWDRNAGDWVRWARTPGYDCMYTSFHREAFLSLLPPPGRRTIDVGCGEGRLTRDLTRLGHRVVALDRSPALTRAAGEAGDIELVLLGDACALPLGNATADLAVAFMALQDMDDMAGAVREIGRVLTPGGSLCCAVVHPINAAGAFATSDGDAPFVIDGSYFAGRRYAFTADRGDLTMTFHQHQRCLADYFNAFEQAGMAAVSVREPVPGDGGRWDRVPLFLHVRAVKREGPGHP